MFRLILRQLRKHWIALAAISVVWLVSMALLFPNRARFASSVSHWFVRLPKPGQQDPVEAYRFVRSAQGRLTDGDLGWFCRWFDTDACLEERKRAPVRLDLMTKACRAIPKHHHGEPDVFRAHWLERRSAWNLTPEVNAPSSQAIVEPAPYWKANRQAVLHSLKDLLDAASYAYEIRPEEVGRPKGPMILIPRLFAEHASALCWDIGGALMWGDYVRFQEDRAEAKLRAAMANYDSFYVFPEERLLAISRALRGDENYELAIRQYLGARPPAMGDPLSCAHPTMRLSCIAPEEAQLSYTKLLLHLPADRLHDVRYNLGLLYLLIGRRGDASALPRAEKQLSAAVRTASTAPDARKNLIRIALLRRDHQKAYELLRELYLSGVRDTEFRTLAQAVLLHLGRFKDSDCFADEADGLFGRRPHCRSVQL